MTRASGIALFVIRAFVIDSSFWFRQSSFVFFSSAHLMRTIVVGGAVANKPLNGGEAWVRLSWVRGLRRLGFRVVLVEQIAAGACVDAAGEPTECGRSVNLAYFR